MSWEFWLALTGMVISGVWIGGSWGRRWMQRQIEQAEIAQSRRRKELAALAQAQATIRQACGKGRR